MRIGIDATALPPEPVGAGVYIINLVRALAGVNVEHELVVFAQRDRRDLFEIPPTPGLTWWEVADKTPALRLLWEQTIFPVLIQQARIDLLHSLHYTRPLILPCASVVTFHDLTFFLYPHLHTRSKRLFFPIAMRLSARLAQALIAVSDSTCRDAMRLLNIPSRKIFAVPNGVSEEFHPISDQALLEEGRRKYGLPPEFILYVGTVEPRKNLPLLLRAYTDLAQEGIVPPLVVVGRLGWMYEEVFRQIDLLGLKGKIHFPGYIPAQDLPIVYNLARIFVYPSLYEGFGFPPLEAMACGTPVITTAISAMLDQVGQAGLLVPPEDGQALTQAMRDLLDDRSLQEQLSAKGRLQVAQFTWKRTAQATLKVYQHVQANRK